MLWGLCRQFCVAAVGLGGLAVSVSFCSRAPLPATADAPAGCERHRQESRLLTIVCLLLPFVHAVPVLGGRTALQAYTDLMVAFKAQFSELLGVVVTDANIGLGPKGELRYPSNPLDSRWNFPGIGEFQVCGAHGWGWRECAGTRSFLDCSARQYRLGSAGVNCF